MKFLLLAALLFAKTPAPKYITLSPVPEVKAHPGETVSVEVKFKVDPGLHVQANPASKPNLIATAVTLDSVSEIEVGAPHYPAGKPFRLKGVDTDISVYDGDVVVKFPVTIVDKAAPKRLSLKGKLRYQACEATSCFFPMSAPFEVLVIILSR